LFNIQQLTACKQYCLAAGATQGNIAYTQNVIANANRPSVQQQNELKIKTMKTNILIIIFTTLTVLISCNSKQEENLGYGEENINTIADTRLSAPPPMDEVVKYSPPVAAEDIEYANSKAETLGNKTSVRTKKIIKDGNISIKTNDINASKKSIDDLLKKLKAYYEGEELQNNDKAISYELKIRIPADNFEKLISSLENGKDEIKSKNIQAHDVTEEYVDIETRLTNKREYLKRYKELLSKASTVNDILAIEENIRTLQEEIESKEGRLKYLSDQVSFSTLDISLYKEKEFIYKPVPQDKFSERVKTSLSNGWTSVVDFVLWTITIWPYIILTIFGIIAIRRVIKKRKSRQS
jgi:hypothetical protein